MIFILHVVDGQEYNFAEKNIEVNQLQELLIDLIQNGQKHSDQSKCDISFVTKHFKCNPYENAKSVRELLYVSKAFNFKKNIGKWKESKTLDKIIVNFSTHSKCSEIAKEISKIKREKLNYQVWRAPKSTKEN